MKFLDRVEKWDKLFCRKVCGVSQVNTINTYVHNKRINAVYYLDIGANVGKVYDDINLLVNIEKAFLIEPSWIFMYLTGKYKSDDKVDLFNLALSDVNEIGFLQQEALKRLHEQDIDESNMNLGTAKLAKSGTEILVRNAFDFLNDELRLYKNKINIIKIDTENRDFQILKSLLPYIAERKEKPLILFEYNYNGLPLTMTEDEAKEVHDAYIDLGYESVSGFPAKGDGYFAVK